MSVDDQVCGLKREIARVKTHLGISVTAKKLQKLNCEFIKNADAQLKKEDEDTRNLLVNILCSCLIGHFYNISLFLDR